MIKTLKFKNNYLPLNIFQELRISVKNVPQPQEIFILFSLFSFYVYNVPRLKEN